MGTAVFSTFAFYTFPTHIAHCQGSLTLCTEYCRSKFARNLLVNKLQLRLWFLGKVTVLGMYAVLTTPSILSPLARIEHGSYPHYRPRV